MIATHGVMIHVGTAGEHIVCADLILRGHKAFMTTAGLAYDVVADIDGRTYRIAVKSTLEARPRIGRTLTRACYQFGVTCGGKHRYDGKADIVALVGLDRRLVCYLPALECPTLIHLDEPDVVIPRLNCKGPIPGKCKQFSDFTLEAAIAGVV